MPPDPRALVFTNEAFGACNDGTKDNTDALQRAINTLEETCHEGILFIPEGTYLFEGSMDLWPKIRLIGFGETRPRFVLKDYAEGFEGPLSKYLFFARDERPHAEHEFLRGANECTFVDSFRNIDIDLGRGNPGAVFIHNHVAQLCSIEDCDFYLHDAKAAMEFVGNEVERCRFFGGKYAIIAHHTSPGWQFYVGDCVFDGQARASIMSNKAGLTLVRDLFRNVPWGIYVPNKELFDSEMNETERLYMEDCRAENISTAVVSMGWIRNPINWLHAVRTICRNAPMFLEAFGYQFVYFFLEPPIVSEYPVYQAESHIGFAVKANNTASERKFDYNFNITEAEWSDVPEPDYMECPDFSSFVSVLDYGAAGDGVCDDTAAFEKAIAEHDHVYVPLGQYRLTRGLTLHDGSALLGLHPSGTQLLLENGVYTDSSLKDPALLTVSKDAVVHVAGLHFYGGINPVSTTILWKGARASLLEDSELLQPRRNRKVNTETSSAEKSSRFYIMKPGRNLNDRSKVRIKGEEQLHSIWIQGGSGVFKNIWTNDDASQEALYISDSMQGGKVYMVSAEHHDQCEVRLERIANWEFIALQTEEAFLADYACSIIAKDCRDLLFANLFQYRQQSFETKAPYAMKLEHCRYIRVWGLHAFSNGPNGWEKSVYIQDSQSSVTDCEIGTLSVYT